MALGLKQPEDFSCDDKIRPLQGFKHIWYDTESKPYHQFYFSDETSTFQGPWLTAAEAVAQLDFYDKYILNPAPKS